MMLCGFLSLLSFDSKGKLGDFGIDSNDLSLSRRK
jgi:hypothetical protein